MIQDGENTYGEERTAESDGSDWSAQSETNLDSDYGMDDEEPGKRCRVETESGDQVQGTHCRHQETIHILRETETEVPNEILNSLAAQAFLDLYGIKEREKDDTVEEPLTGSIRSQDDFKEVDNVNDNENRELMSGTDIPGVGGLVQQSANYLKCRDFTRAKRKRKRQQQDKNRIDEAR